MVNIEISVFVMLMLGYTWKAASYNSLPGCCLEELEARGIEVMLALQQSAATVDQEVQFVTHSCVPMPCPEQDNGVECGMFTVGFAAAMMLDIVATPHAALMC